MGTWNATCAITQLPIEEGRAVVMIPLICKPPDHLARDNISGSGSSSNDILAQPFSLPLRGAYNGVGGIDRTKDDVGLACLTESLRSYVQSKRLYKLKDAEPVLCKNLPRNAMELLSAGDLLIMTPNPRKEWLQALRKLYDESDNKQGLSHYEAQLRVDPETLPDMIAMPLSLNFVSTTLYNALTHKVGAGKAFERWNDEKEKVDTFKGTRAKQIASDLTLKPDVGAKMKLAMAAFNNDLGDLLDTKEKETSQEVKDMIVALYLKKVAPHAFKEASELYFSPHGVQAALQDTLLNDNNALREELVGFSLFASAMVQMRKQWVPQTGAGDSNGLQEESIRSLHALTGQFIASSCSLAEPDEPRM